MYIILVGWKMITFQEKSTSLINFHNMIRYEAVQMRHLSSIFQYMQSATGTMYQSNPNRHGGPQAASFQTTVQKTLIHQA